MYLIRRKMMAAAVGIACCLAGGAQAQATVTVYGKLYPQMTNYRTSTGTAAGTAVSTLVSPVGTTVAGVSGAVMESSNSYIGFRGTEDLGNNMKAIFQLEGAFGVDDGSLSSVGFFFNRNTFLGLQGDFGRVRMGRIDTVYKNITDTMGFMGLQSGNFVSASNILAQRGFGATSAHRFHERPSNTIDYQSPSFGGFTAYAGYSFGEVAGDFKKGSNISTGVSYSAGPLYLAVAHEQHNKFYGGSRNVPLALRNITAGGGTGAAFVAVAGTDSKDTSTRVSALYQLTSATRMEASFSMTKLGESGGTAGKFESYKQNNWLMGVEHTMGAWTLIGTYGRASAGSCSLVGGVACSTDGLEGSMLSLGGAYALSKRTALFALFSDMQNGKSASYSNAGQAVVPTTGQDLSQIALGIRHTF
ncbi:MAG: porin [Herminiimonas sp.]|uniref:porin n=1 Tax=Herminiimonas sp. TaxID=1926289 RepID=UPI002719C749|nr:porin [Herminiimonas sp.]MDO9420608.1 porin [Herminiimonas sp.]